MFGHASQGVPQPRGAKEGNGVREATSEPISEGNSPFPTDDDEIQRADSPTVYRGID
ncbi:hypothetical protein BKA25_001373 [Actinoalloteichus hymeniacidonis]|uniref:Uncharacterized protein n=1 Tax=Actinoalloteichus hymeniacidonis TaxID=340345 RepID=A0AAC9HSZ1_9PSEU|nr:hypothetical protein TL08_20385 [Actinoalloteichus hymeniacidonis]MBB5907057.1 hypothetical protein [Actinoalloteichus hymeniacidonis]